MLEFMLCSLFTLVPDFLYRRYYQGKRLGTEITIYSVWYELRYGITGCLLLTLALITTILYFHPSTTSVNLFYRVVPILPEAGGRVAEIYVGPSQDVTGGAKLFRLDSSKQEAAVLVAKRRISEIDAAMVLARADIEASEGQVQQATGAYEQAVEELQTKQELRLRNPDVVAVREIERLAKVVETRQGAVTAATASKRAAETKLTTFLPAEKASAEAVLAQAQVDLDKTIIYAGTSGRVEQFTLRVGDFVNPFMRPAGVLIPRAGHGGRLVAGFGQIEAQVIKPGMIGEVTCVAKPLTIIPMVATSVQRAIAAGQVRASDQLLDPTQLARPGTLAVFFEPLYEGGFDDVPPGSSCIANAYSNHHAELASKELSSISRFLLHAVDAVGLVHAMVLRLHALVLPVKVLVGAPH